MTKIPREFVDQKDIVQDIAMVQGYSFWREHMIEQMCSCFAFPTAWFWNRSWKRKRVKLLGHILRRPRSHPQYQVTVDTRTGNTKDLVKWGNEEVNDVLSLTRTETGKQLSRNRPTHRPDVFEVMHKHTKVVSSWFLACSPCFLVWPFAELCYVPGSFSDLVHAVQSVARGKCQKESQAYSGLGQGQMKADIASVVSLLTQQPRALQKHARLLVTMQKRILGQRPAVGTRYVAPCWILKRVMSKD